MTTYADWVAQHPQAAADLQQLIGAMPWPASEAAAGHSEAWAQQQVRLAIAHQGGMSWRNNVGATPARCPDCGAKQRPVRYGLANDSQQLNERIKSSDLVGAVPRIVTPDMLGTTIAQFVAVEAKRPGWSFSGTKHEQAQAAWLAMITKLGGMAQFSTGEISL